MLGSSIFQRIKIICVIICNNYKANTGVSEIYSVVKKLGLGSKDRCSIPTSDCASFIVDFINSAEQDKSRGVKPSRVG